MKKRVLLYVLPLFFLWSCAAWVMVGGKHSELSQNYEVDLPSGWRRFNLSTDAVRLTKDAITLQLITIARVPVDRELPHTKKKLSKGMLPQEAAEVITDNIRSNPNTANPQVAENSPARVGGYPGFKLIYGYQTKQGVKIKSAYYGVILEDWHYYLLYEAPERYYFARDYPVFEKVKETFRVTKGGTA